MFGAALTRTGRIDGADLSDLRRTFTGVCSSPPPAASEAASFRHHSSRRSSFDKIHYDQRIQVSAKVSDTLMERPLRQDFPQAVTDPMVRLFFTWSAHTGCR